MEKVSYALGLSLGNNLLNSGIEKLDYAKLAKGIQDVMEQNKPEINYQEAQTIINEFFEALQAKADIYITGDIKYHQFFDIGDRMIIVDIGHYESEQFTKELFYEIVTNKFSKFALRLSEVQTNPVNYLF